VKLEKNESDICAILSEAYGGDAVERASVFEWHERFKEGHENVENDERCGRPRSYRTGEYVKNLQNLVHSDRRLSIRAMAVQLSLDTETDRF
jgi:hypothetical protein